MDKRVKYNFVILLLTGIVSLAALGLRPGEMDDYVFLGLCEDLWKTFQNISLNISFFPPLPVSPESLKDTFVGIFGIFAVGILPQWLMLKCKWRFLQFLPLHLSVFFWIWGEYLYADSASMGELVVSTMIAGSGIYCTVCAGVTCVIYTLYLAFRKTA